MRGPTLRLATRRSALATTQAGWVADLLRARGHAVDLVPLVTEGDTNRAALTDIGGTGVFASALREAVLAGVADLAVHSLKDLPSAPAPGLIIAAVPVREDPRDVLVSRHGAGLRELPAGSVVGTGSPRRAAQLTLLRPDLQVRPVRGNIETRLSLVAEGSCEAIVLARAGLVRLGRLDVVSEVLRLEDMLPAAGQGALAVECREDRDDVRALLEGIEDPQARARVTAERALLATLEGGCAAPIGAHADLVQGRAGIALVLTAFLGTTETFSARATGVSRRASLSGSPAEAEALGCALARRLLDAREAPPAPQDAGGARTTKQGQEQDQ
ncbi:MAG: hydroxymethylbilane synthase [Dermatophilaceae bacterium]